MSTDLHYLTIAQASSLIRAGKLSPVDLTCACLNRIAELDDTLHAFILVLAESALAQARAAEAEIKAGAWKGPLHGIPIGLKDIYNTAGVATTGHSALFRAHVPPEDATTVRKLHDAGAVIIGKLSTYEFAIGGPSFDLPWPPARNPWNPAHQPGGSSSGSGAAVAAGMCPGAMGTDTGGSIRFPAALCGIAGIKPTYGLVSRRGILPLAFSLDHGGPMCWTSEDCALMLAVLAGHDPLDPGSADVPLPDYAASLDGKLAGLRVGVVRHFFERDIATDAEVGAALESALRVLARQGAVLTDVTLPSLGVFSDVCMTIVRAEAYGIHQRTLVATPELYGESARLRIAGGALVTGSDYVNAQRHRAALNARVSEVMRDVDVLVMPTWAEPAAPMARDESVLFPATFTMPFNVTGQPALSVCSGFSTSGLPLAMQIVGRAFEDHVALKVGDAFERATSFRDVRPNLTVPQTVAA